MSHAAQLGVVDFLFVPKGRNPLEPHPSHPGTQHGEPGMAGRWNSGRRLCRRNRPGCPSAIGTESCERGGGQDSQVEQPPVWMLGRRLRKASDRDANTNQMVSDKGHKNHTQEQAPCSAYRNLPSPALRASSQLAHQSSPPLLRLGQRPMSALFPDTQVVANTHVIHGVSDRVGRAGTGRRRRRSCCLGRRGRLEQVGGAILHLAQGFGCQAFLLLTQLVVELLSLRCWYWRLNGCPPVRGLPGHRANGLFVDAEFSFGAARHGACEATEPCERKWWEARKRKAVRAGRKQRPKNEKNRG